MHGNAPYHVNWKLEASQKKKDTHAQTLIPLMRFMLTCNDTSWYAFARTTFIGVAHELRVFVVVVVAVVFACASSWP